MAIFNAQTVKTATANWKTATFTATSSTSSEVTSISFTVTEQPKSWALSCFMGGSYYQTPTTTSIYYTTGAYYDGSSVTGAELNGGSSIKLYPNTSSPTGSYSNGTFTVTAGTNRYFPMRRSSYYVTWVLFYTV